MLGMHDLQIPFFIHPFDGPNSVDIKENSQVLETIDLGKQHGD